MKRKIADRSEEDNKDTFANPNAGEQYWRRRRLAVISRRLKGRRCLLHLSENWPYRYSCERFRSR
jgi:hypothetical protein